MNYREERPWGSFEILHEENNLKVKKILVKSGKRLSLQSHKHRSENWIIVQGKALVTLNENEHELNITDSIFIPAKAKHRIANSHPEEVIFIEVQTGSYLGEDDIIRYQDDFNRD
jgi:mannose-6-phosphate isomerase-like protein (cupin superfamily)